MELGDLSPIRTVRETLVGWIEDDRARRPSDPGLVMLEKLLRMIDSGIADAVNPEMELTAKQMAQAQGISVDAFYKRQQRAKRGARSAKKQGSNAGAVAKPRKDAAEQAA